MRISDWSSDVCSSDLGVDQIAGDQTMRQGVAFGGRERERRVGARRVDGLVAQIFAVFDDLPVRPLPFPYRRQLFQHPAVSAATDIADRKSVVKGTMVSVRVDVGGCSIITKKIKTYHQQIL